MKLSTKCLLTTFGAAAAARTAYAVQRRVNQRNQRFDQDTGFELKEYRMINGIQQYLVHRTENDENPVLLVLHGGRANPRCRRAICISVNGRSISRW